LNLLKPEIYYHHTNIGMKVNPYYHKNKIAKPKPLSEVFQDKPHLQALLNRRRR